MTMMMTMTMMMMMMMMMMMIRIRILMLAAAAASAHDDDDDDHDNGTSVCVYAYGHVMSLEYMLENLHRLHSQLISNRCGPNTQTPAFPHQETVFTHVPDLMLMFALRM